MKYLCFAEVRHGASPGVRSVEVQTPPASPTSSHPGPRITPGGLLASFDKSILQVSLSVFFILRRFILVVFHYHNKTNK